MQRLELSGVMQFSVRAHDRRRDARRLRPADGPAPSAKGGSWTRSPSRRRRTRHRRSCSDRSTRSSRPTHASGPGSRSPRTMPRKRTSSSPSCRASSSPLAVSRCSSAPSSSRTRCRSRSPSGRVSSPRSGRSELRAARSSGRSSSRRSSSAWWRPSSVCSSACSSRGVSSASSTWSASRSRTRGSSSKREPSVVALLVGVLVTVFASLRPAIRATRVPADRSGARGCGASAGSRSTRFRWIGALLMRSAPRRRIRHLRDSGEHALVDSARRARPARNPPRVRAVPVAHAWSGRVLRLRLRSAGLRPVRHRPRHDAGPDLDGSRRAPHLPRGGAETYPGLALAHVPVARWSVFA